MFCNKLRKGDSAKMNNRRYNKDIKVDLSRRWLCRQPGQEERVRKAGAGIADGRGSLETSAWANTCGLPKVTVPR